MLCDLKLYVKKLTLKQAARQWVEAEGLKAACLSMYHLNRVTHYSRIHSRAIYALKNKLVEWLYENGYCIAVTWQCQTLDCWTCAGTGEYAEGETCWKCGGSGIYATHELYKFVFLVKERTYVWHQPASLVNFVERCDTDHNPQYLHKPVSYYRQYDPDLLSVYYFTVRTFLQDAGYRDLIDIGPTPKTLWRSFVSEVDRRVQQFFKHLRRVRDEHIAHADYDEIPF